jgi:hypothetical protein
LSDPGRSRLAAAYFIVGLLAAGAIATVVVLVTGGEDSGESASTLEAFEPRYEGLEARRIAAGVPTMAEGGGEHFHSKLQLYADGKQIQVPANIGIDPGQPPTLMAGLHTHDTSGTIHNEAGEGATLGDFFAVWGIPFSKSELGPYSSSGADRVQMRVDGEPSAALGDLELEDGQEITVTYGEPPQDIGLP